MLPIDDFVNDGLLLGGCSAEIDSGCLYALVAHKIGEKSEVVVSFKEILGIAMAERMRIYNGCVQAIFLSKEFQLLRYPSCRYSLAETVEKYIARLYLSLLKPFGCFGLEILWDVEPAQFSTFGIDVEIALTDVLCFDLQ